MAAVAMTVSGASRRRQTDGLRLPRLSNLSGGTAELFHQLIDRRRLEVFEKEPHQIRLPFTRKVRR